MQRKYKTQTIPCLEDENLVKFYIYDTENKTIEETICTKEMAKFLHEVYRQKNWEEANNV